MQHEKTFTTESETELTSTQNHESDTTEKIVSTTLFYTTSCHCYSPIEEIGCNIVNITNLSYNLKMSRAQDRWQWREGGSLSARGSKQRSCDFVVVMNGDFWVLWGEGEKDSKQRSCDFVVDFCGTVLLLSVVRWRKGMRSQIRCCDMKERKV